MTLNKLMKLFKSSYVSLDDEELMRLLMEEKNHQAFEVLYLRHKDMVYSYLLKNSSKEIAEDLMQQIFIKVVDRSETFKFESKFKTWLWTIVRNSLIDYWRSVNHNQRNNFEEYDDENQIDENSSIEEALTLKIEKKMLEDCINELPEKEKEIYLLYCYSEASAEEISKVAKVNSGKIKNALFRGREKIERCVRGKIKE